MADTPIVFTREDENGKTWEKTATTPAEAVKLRFDGWREKKVAATKAKAGSEETKTAK